MIRRNLIVSSSSDSACLLSKQFCVAWYTLEISVCNVVLTRSWQVVIAMYTSKDETQRKQINAFMTSFQEHPQSWTRVDSILEKTQCEQSKFFALATLEHCVKYR